MPRVLLVTTATLACFAMTLGCGRGRKASPSPRPSAANPTVIIGSPPASRSAAPAFRSIPKAARPKPSMSTPPVDRTIDERESIPPRVPAPSTPNRAPAQYRDGCGRPLVAKSATPGFDRTGLSEGEYLVVGGSWPDSKNFPRLNPFKKGSDPFLPIGLLFVYHLVGIWRPVGRDGRSGSDSHSCDPALC